MWSLVDEKLLDIVLRLKLNVERKVKVKANAVNWFVRKFFVAKNFLIFFTVLLVSPPRHVENNLSHGEISDFFP